MTQETKDALRKRLLIQLHSQKEEDRIKKSRVIEAKLFAMPEFQRSQTILFYASFDGEVETFAMMKHAQQLGKSLALPTVRKSPKKITPTAVSDLAALIAGPFGILQPSPSERALDVRSLDLVLVPAVAFDRSNNRLGRGAGFYDRFLGELPPDIPTVGLAFDFQVVDRLDHLASHDHPVSRVISN